MAEKRNDIPPPIDTGGAVKCKTETCLAAYVTPLMTGSDRSGWILCPASGHIVTAVSYMAIVTVIICSSENERDRDGGGQGMPGHCWLYRPLYLSVNVWTDSLALKNSLRPKLHSCVCLVLLEGLDVY